MSRFRGTALRLASDAASPERRKEDFAAAMAAARPIMWFGEAPPEEERWSPFSWSHKPLSKVWWGEAVFEVGKWIGRSTKLKQPCTCVRLFLGHQMVPGDTRLDSNPRKQRWMDRGRLMVHHPIRDRPRAPGGRILAPEGSVPPGGRRARKCAEPEIARLGGPLRAEGTMLTTGRAPGALDGWRAPGDAREEEGEDGAGDRGHVCCASVAWVKWNRAEICRFRWLAVQGRDDKVSSDICLWYFPVTDV